MKSLLLFSAAFLIAFNLSAQLDKGWVYTGGTASVSFGSEKFTSGSFTSTDRLFGINAGPTLGYFFADMLMVGLNVNFGYSSQVDTDDNTVFIKSSSFGGGPFGRYYFGQDFFVHAGVLYSIRKTHSSFGQGSEFENKNNVFDINAGVGKAIFFNEYISIEPMILYNRQSISYPDSPDQSEAINQFFFMVAFGIYVDQWVD